MRNERVTDTLGLRLLKRHPFEIAHTQSAVVAHGMPAVGTLYVVRLVN